MPRFFRRSKPATSNLRPMQPDLHDAMRAVNDPQQQMARLLRQQLEAQKRIAAALERDQQAFSRAIAGLITGGLRPRGEYRIVGTHRQTGEQWATQPTVYYVGDRVDFDIALYNRDSDNVHVEYRTTHAATTDWSLNPPGNDPEPPGAGSLVIY